ncbi:MAG: penicillin-binding protein 2 [bacterium]|nr:penicillin-binding protein 2 [bacterium]
MQSRGTKRPVRRSADVRLLSIALLFIGAWLTIAYQLFQIQVVDYREYTAAAERQRIRVEETGAARGTIYDRQGRELAVSIEARSIYANPRQVVDAAAAALALSDALGLDIDRLREKLLADTTFVFLARQVEVAEAEAVEALNLPGVHFLNEPKRVYPSGSLAAHAVGFVNVDSQGIEGLEAQYNDLLTGIPGHILAERAAGGQVIPHGRFEVEPAVPGADLVISIDREIQFMAHRACVETVVTTNAKRCTVVALDPFTFEILAMVVVPSFDPSDRTEQDIANGTLTNAAVRSLYEPGSTQKAVTISAALEEGVVDWDTQYLVYDSIEIVNGACTNQGEDGENAIFGCYTDFSAHPPEVMTVRDCVRLSSNVCTVKIGQALGRDRLREYLDAFGYGSSTGVDFPGEALGTVNLPTSCSTCPASAAIGYSISVSPLQMASVYATIANGGLRMEPRLVSGVVTTDGVTRQPAPTSTRVISEDTARRVRLMLKSVVDSGTGVKAAVPGYTVGGKTGTTRMFDFDLGRYSDEYVASFVGMAPVDHPRLVMAVVVDAPNSGEPVAARTGGVVAAPLFSRVMEGSLHQMGVGPDA